MSNLVSQKAKFKRVNDCFLLEINCSNNYCVALYAFERYCLNFKMGYRNL